MNFLTDAWNEHVKGQWVLCWHPDSPGVKQVVYRPWWRRKGRPFASLHESIVATRRNLPVRDVRSPRPKQPRDRVRA